MQSHKVIRHAVDVIKFFDADKKLSAFFSYILVFKKQIVYNNLE